MAITPSKVFGTPRTGTLGYPFRMNKREQRLLQNLYPNAPLVEENANNYFRYAHTTYDFAVSGGLVSTIALILTPVIPANSIILGVALDVITSVTSGGAGTWQLKLTTDGALTNAIAKADLAASCVVVGVTANTTFTPLKTTVDQSFSVVVGTAALTAGKIRCYVKWAPSTAT